MDYAVINVGSGRVVESALNQAKALMGEGMTAEDRPLGEGGNRRTWSWRAGMFHRCSSSGRRPRSRDLDDLNMEFQNGDYRWACWENDSCELLVVFRNTSDALMFKLGWVT